jgi:hypothetical protein
MFFTMRLRIKDPGIQALLPETETVQVFRIPPEGFGDRFMKILSITGFFYFIKIWIVYYSIGRYNSRAAISVFVPE